MNEVFKYKMVVVYRTDINLSKGKLAVQVAHAAVNCALESKKSDKRNFKSWYGEGQKKVVVKVKSEEDLFVLREKAMDLGITTSLVRDSGLTEVEPGTITVLGVGPASNPEIDKVTGDLKLL